MAVWEAVVVIHSDQMPGPGTNTWHVEADPPPSDDAETNGALLDMETILAEFYAVLCNWTPGGASFVWNGEWRLMGGAEQMHSTPGWLAGSNFVLTAMPPADCLAIKWRASTGGRSGRGKTFLGPLAKSTLQDNGTPEETFRTAMEGAADDLVAAGADAGPSRFCVWSVKDNIGRPITSREVPNKFASLRSRRD